MVKMTFWDVAELDLAMLNKTLRQAILESCRAIFDDWTIGKLLTGRLSKFRTHRVGMYRIVYTVRKSSSIEIVAIGHRRDIYERMT